MVGKNKRQIKDITFVQPLEGEVYFYAPIAYATYLQNPQEKERKLVFEDSDLALAGKLKLIFEREKMTWFEIKEERARAPTKNEHYFALYYYPHRLVASCLRMNFSINHQTSSLDEKATLQSITKMFDFIVNEDQTRNADIVDTRPQSAYESIAGEPYEEPEPVTAVAPAAEEPHKEPEPVTIVAIAAVEPNKEVQAIPAAAPAANT